MLPSPLTPAAAARRLSPWNVEVGIELVLPLQPHMAHLWPAAAEADALARWNRRPWCVTRRRRRRALPARLSCRVRAFVRASACMYACVCVHVCVHMCACCSWLASWIR